MLQFMTLCFLLISSVLAAPAVEQAVIKTQKFEPRDVIDPPILIPNSKTVWKSGQRVTVTWNTTDFPPDSQITNPNGTLLLGFLTEDSENLMIDNPLADGFKLRIGHINITVPDVPTRHNYIVVLMGSSGNASPEFLIIGKNQTSTTSSSTTSSSSPPKPTLTTSNSDDATTSSTFTPSPTSTTPVAANTTQSSSPAAETTTIPSACHQLKSSGMISLGAMLLVLFLNA